VAPEQTILMTVIPRGITVDEDTLPVSVFVTPRLRGALHLGAFRDWQLWTRRLADDGLTLTMRCGSSTVDIAVDQASLEPAFWEGLFNERTLVRSHEFDDYTGRAIFSFSVRRTLSVLKAIYQEAAVALALPDRPGEEHERGNRRTLRDLLDGLDVHWNPDLGERWRTQLRAGQRYRRFGRLSGPIPADTDLDGEGLLTAPRTSAMSSAVAIPFSVFHHMPIPDRSKHALEQDWDSHLDFHQALASLNAYSGVQRALGVVFDLELPTDFVPVTLQYSTLSVAGVNAGWDWSLAPQVPEVETACVHLELEDGRRVFLTAPRVLVEPSARVAPVVGLLDLDPRRFGVAQVDVDGGMHKAIMLAETWVSADPARNLEGNAEPEPAQHPEVFDPEATLPALRSGGFSFFADERAQALLETIHQSQAFNDTLESGGAQPRPFCSEDLVRGYRLDVWDSASGGWHSLHVRKAEYAVPGLNLPFDREEGFVQLAAMQAAKGAEPGSDDLYLHEAVARWAGWSLAVEMPGKHLSRYADPDHALPPDGDDGVDYSTNQPVTPFKLTPTFHIVKGTLPKLRFGRRYRFRARAVDLAGAGLEIDDAIAGELADVMALPRDPGGFAYLRYEPVPAPLVVIRDEQAVTGPGSSVDRLVIRTANDGVSHDADPADLSGSERHILPPRASVEMCERLGLFDTSGGELQSDAGTWKLIADRDAGELQQSEIDVAGKTDSYPLESGDSVDPLPYLPDALSVGAAFRDFPGTPAGTLGRVEPGGAAGVIDYTPLSDPNPRPGSATLVAFGDHGDWEKVHGFRLALVEPSPGDADPSPSWDPVARVLSVPLAKGTTATLPLSSYLRAEDMTLMGQWQWLREYVEQLTINEPEQQHLVPGSDADRIAHVLQRAVEGGHWLLTPPRLLTLVHAVQQPVGRPEFISLDVEHDPARAVVDDPLQTKPIAGRADPTELASITAWRRFGATDAYLMGALRVHGASTAKVDLLASWNDPVDESDPEAPMWTMVHHNAHVDELPLPTLREGYLVASGTDRRRVGYYDPQNDQIGFVKAGDWTGRRGRNEITFTDAAPRHLITDTKHHRVTYTAVVSSRFREYFPQEGLDFTRSSDPVVVDVPASARPLAAAPVYVIPTFGWQRQTETNVKRSVRFGGGLRVYLRRPWFSSGEGELLGVALWSNESGLLDPAQRDKFKPFITQWGMDPIWQTAELSGTPSIANFPDAIAHDVAVTLEEPTAHGPRGAPGRVDVVGFEPEFDEERGLWFADLTIDTFTPTYMPFVRLALVRYQPSALLDAKISRVVLADIAQLTPDRSAIVSCDPYHPKRVQVVVSGVAPRGPGPEPGRRATEVRVRVQRRDESVSGDLGWNDAPETASIAASSDGPIAAQPDLVIWAGAVTFAEDPEPGQYRLLVEEREYVVPGDPPVEGGRAPHPGRLIFAETFELDSGLISSN
jgi:hypothetical protein